MKIDKIGIVIPTCSAERKPFLEFVLKRMNAQTMRPDHIALIDFIKQSKAPDLVMRYKIGIKECIDNGCSFILFIEDDDYYPIIYIESMYNLWLDNNRPKIIGCNKTIYYHLFTKGWQIINTSKHASAHGTAVSKDVNYMLCRNDSIYFDIELWKENRNDSKLVYFPDHCISIKHGIGACGGGGHNGKIYKTFDNDLYEKLQSLLDKEGFEFYTGAVKQLQEEEKQRRIKDPLQPEYYDRIYCISDEYRKCNPEKSIYFPIWKATAFLLNNTNTILEIGCGNGLTARYLMSQGINYQRGIDFSEEAITLARRNNPSHENKFQVKDIKGITTIPNHFTVICLETLEHLENDLSFLLTLQKDTTIIFSVPDFSCDAHQRFFKDEQEVFYYYSELISFEMIKKIMIAPTNSIFLVKGVRI